MKKSQDFFRMRNPFPFVSQQLKKNPTLLDFSHTVSLREAFQISYSVSESPLIQFLNNTQLCQVEVVDLSGHAELDNTMLYLFEKLPNLKTLILKNISPDEFAISGKELVRFYAKGINIKADPDLIQAINTLISCFLVKNNQKEYASVILKKGVNDETFDSVKFKNALVYERKKRQAAIENTHRFFQDAKQLQERFKFSQQLLEFYKTGVGEFSKPKGECFEMKEMGNDNTLKKGP